MDFFSLFKPKWRSMDK